MKFILFALIFLNTSCALLEQVQDPDKYRVSHTPTDPYDSLKFDSSLTPIADFMFGDDKEFSKFKKTLCSELKDKECMQKYVETFYYRLEEKYTHANADEVVKHCKAHPIECYEFKYVEQVAINSHNNGVENTKQREIASAREKDRQRTANVLQAIGQGIQAQQEQQQQQQFQQQLINNMNRPVNTYCQRNGAGVWCQSN